MRLRLFVASLLVALSLAAPLAQARLAGDWNLTFNTPMGSLDANATFKVDGDKLSGTISSPAGETPIAGSVKGATFNFTFNVQGPNGDLNITMSGEQDGDAIKGTFDFGQGQGDWVGKRKD
jgi:hypothetical protein